MTIVDALSEYLLHCERERHLAPKTIAAYSTDLHQVATYLERELGMTSLSAINRTSLRLYFDTIKDLAATSRRRKEQTLKAFLAFHHGQGRLARNPAVGLELEKSRGKTDRDTVSPPDLELLAAYLRREAAILDEMEAPTFEEPVIKVRDLALMEILAAAGLYAGEIVALQGRDVRVSPDEVRIHVPEGAGVERTLALQPSRARRALLTYRRLSEPCAADPFFRSASGGKLSKQAVARIVSAVGVAAGLSAPLTPGMIRNALGQQLLLAGENPWRVQALLGHRSIGTTLALVDRGERPVTGAIEAGTSLADLDEIATPPPRSLRPRRHSELGQRGRRGRGERRDHVSA